MSIVINTNMGALYAQRALNNSMNSLAESVKRLSTGYRINSAKDDAAGYYIASKLDTQIRGLNNVSRNVQIAGNVLDTAAGDLSTITEQLKEIRDLTVQYSSSIYDEENRNAIKAEVQQRVDEINRIAASSSFNGKNLLDGTAQDLRIQVGTGADPAANAIVISGDVFASADAQGINLIGGTGQYSSIDEAFANATAAAAFINDIDTAINDVSSRASQIGTYSSRLESVVDSVAVQKENLTGAHSAIMDTDIAQETANIAKQQLLAQTSLAMFAQVNQLQSSMVLSLIDSL